METVGLSEKQESVWEYMSKKMDSMSKADLQELLEQTELAQKNLLGGQYSFIGDLQKRLIKSKINRK